MIMIIILKISINKNPKQKLRKKKKKKSHQHATYKIVFFYTLKKLTFDYFYSFLFYDFVILLIE